MSIKVKLTFAFIGIILLGLTVGIIGLVSVNKIYRNIFTVTEELFPASLASKELDVAIGKIDSGFKSIVSAQNLDEVENAVKDIESSLKKTKGVIASLQKEFKEQEVIKRIDLLKVKVEEISKQKDVVYVGISNVIKLKEKNEDLREKINDLLESITGIINHHVEVLNFDAFSSLRRTQDQLTEAANSLEEMATTYRDYSEKHSPAITRILTLKGYFEEASKDLERMIHDGVHHPQAIKSLKIYEEKLVSSLEHVKKVLGDFRKEGTLAESVINELSQSLFTYEKILLGKDGIIDLLRSLSEANVPPERLAERIHSTTREQLAPIEEQVTFVASAIIDNNEFAMFLGAERAKEAIRRGEGTFSHLKTDVGFFLEQMFPLSSGWLRLKGNLYAGGTIINQILGEENLELLSLHESTLNAAVSSIDEDINYLMLRELQKADAEVEAIESVGTYFEAIKEAVVGEGGILESRKNLLDGLRKSRIIVSNVSQRMIEVAAMVVETVEEIGKQAIEASDSAKAVVVFSRGLIGVTSTIVIILGLGIAILFSTFIAKNLNLVTGFLSNWIRDLSARRGDLTTRLRMKAKDELGRLGNSFDRFLDNFAEMISVIRASSSKVDSSAKNLLSTSQQVNSSLQGVGASIQQISKGAATQVTKVTETYKIISELTDSLKQIAENTNEVAKAVVSATELAGKGRVSNQEIVEKMDSIANVVETSASAVGELGKRSEQIGEIVSTIDSFADQTNLLALNAAIEAARAGEAGRGFAVVADEVRKLAEASSSSANEIRRLIESVQSDVGNVINLISAGMSESEEGKSILERVSSLQENIANATKLAENMTGEISRLIPEQLKKAERASNAISEVNTIAQENAASTQEVSSSTEEMSSSMEELVSNADELTSVVAQLKSLIGQFKSK